MENSDVETGTNEQTPLSGEHKMSRMKTSIQTKAKEKVPKSVQEKGAQLKDKSEWKFVFCAVCCPIFCILIFVGVGYIIFEYYKDTLEARERTDHKPTVVSEQWIDYLAPDVVAPEWPYKIMRDQVNCTNIHPCRNWDCLYVREHFHKDPSECEYDDYMDWVSAALVVWVLLIIYLARS